MICCGSRARISHALNVCRSRGETGQIDANFDWEVTYRKGAEPELAVVGLPPGPDRTRAVDSVHGRSAGDDLDKGFFRWDVNPRGTGATQYLSIAKLTIFV